MGAHIRSGKLTKGSHPDGREWGVLGEATACGHDWVVYAKPYGRNGWRSVKLVCDGIAEGKANYRLGWNGERFAEGTPWERPCRDRYELAEKLAAMLSSDP